VAHNSVLIYDPAEKFGSCRWGRLSNDGGQTFGQSPRELSDMLEGGRSHLDGIRRYEHHHDYTYTMGDATKAYSSHKLKSFRRSLVYLRNHSRSHPVIVVYDEVVATKSSFKKTYLLHSIGEPEVRGTIAMVQGNDGVDSANRARLYHETLLPRNSRIKKIGGIANAQEFLAADDGSGQAFNYNEEIRRLHPDIAAQPTAERKKPVFREVGEWRLEVRPVEPKAATRFLNVMSVTDGDSDPKPARTEYVSATHVDGALVANRSGPEMTLVRFFRSEPLPGKTILRNLGARKVLVTGLKAETPYAVNFQDGDLSITQAAGGHVSSSQGTVYIGNDEE